MGRKNLAFKNPALGYDLHKTSNNLDKKNQYAVEFWKLIEYSTDYNISKDISTNTTVNQYKTTLATPAFLNNLHNAIINNNNNTSTKILDTNIIDVRYCVYLKNNLITIKQYFNTDIIPEDDSLIFGPILTLDECNLLINNYAKINNYNIVKNNDYEFMVIKNDNNI